MTVERGGLAATRLLTSTFAATTGPAARGDRVSTAASLPAFAFPLPWGRFTPIPGAPILPCPFLSSRLAPVAKIQVDRLKRMNHCFIGDFSFLAGERVKTLRSPGF